MPLKIIQLNSRDTDLMQALSAMFGVAFNDDSTYSAKPPSEGYAEQLLKGDSFIAVAALQDGTVVGGLAAYELKKFEQERSEIYLYDLAVLLKHRRQGIATALIERLELIAVERGAYEIFVQADTAIEDQPAIALYSKLGIIEEVLHFSIPVGIRGGVA